MFIDRSPHLRQLEDLLSRYPAVGILGARQIGKTTLARRLTACYQGPVSFLIWKIYKTLRACKNRCWRFWNACANC